MGLTLTLTMPLHPPGNPTISSSAELGPPCPVLAKRFHEEIPDEAHRSMHMFPIDHETHHAIMPFLHVFAMCGLFVSSNKMLSCS